MFQSKPAGILWAVNGILGEFHGISPKSTRQIYTKIDHLWYLLGLFEQILEFRGDFICFRGIYDGDPLVDHRRKTGHDLYLRNQR